MLQFFQRFLLRNKNLLFYILFLIIFAVLQKYAGVMCLQAVLDINNSDSE